MDLVADFTQQEKLSISRILLDIACADGEFDPSESEFLSTVQLAFGAKIEMMDELVQAIITRSVAASILILQAMSQEKKEALLLLIAGMSGADGVIDENEVRMATAIIHAIS